jgi:hypothetical protein
MPKAINSVPDPFTTGAANKYLEADLLHRLIGSGPHSIFSIPTHERPLGGTTTTAGIPAEPFVALLKFRQGDFSWSVTMKGLSLARIGFFAADWHLSTMNHENASRQ